MTAQDVLNQAAAEVCPTIGCVNGKVLVVHHNSSLTHEEEDFACKGIGRRFEFLVERCSDWEIPTSGERRLPRSPHLGCLNCGGSRYVTRTVTEGLGLEVAKAMGYQSVFINFAVYQGGYTAVVFEGDSVRDMISGRGDTVQEAIWDAVAKVLKTTGQGG